MRATPFSEFSPPTLGEMLSRHITTATESRCARSASRVIRRRPTRSQGHALEKLGHAIEYLVDSRVHRDVGISSPAESVAEQLLMRLSREVFAECEEIAPAVGVFQKLLRTLSRF